MTKLRLMSNNTWAKEPNSPQWAARGEDCSFTARMPKFLRYYMETEPDVIGFQEMTAAMAGRLMELIGDQKLPYALLWGRDTPILYRSDKFELVDSCFLIYPEEFSGHEGSFNNAKTKSYNAGVFRIKESGTLFILMTTHLWWKKNDPKDPNYQAYSDEARAYQLELAIDRLDLLQAKYNCPAVLMGDMNTEYRTKAIQSALARGFLHAYDVATEHRDEGNGHHYCYDEGWLPYEAKEPSFAIDHILVRGFTSGAVRNYDRYAPDYYIPLSDHIPLWVDLEI